MPLQAQTGIKYAGDGSSVTYRSTRQASTVASKLHGEQFELAYRGQQFAFGLSETPTVAANGIATGVTATAQPLLGLWNPPGSKVVASILTASIVVTTVQALALNPGGFFWVAATGQSAITTGSNSIRASDFVTTVSACKAFAFSTALTGLSGSLTSIRAAAICPTINATEAATALLRSWYPEEKVEGTMIAMPGTFVGIMSQNAGTTTVSAAGMLKWNEIPIG